MPKETGKRQTMLNLATCFSSGDKEKMKCLLWKDDLVSPTLSLEYEQRKFQWLVKYFRPDCFLKVLELIDPDLKQNLYKQNRIKGVLSALEINQQIVDESASRKNITANPD